MGTASYGGKGVRERTRENGESTAGTVSFRWEAIEASPLPPPPPPAPALFDQNQSGCNLTSAQPLGEVFTQSSALGTGTT